MKSRYKELLINSIIFASASIISKIIMFLLLPLYTNRLTNDQYGTVELIISGIDLLTPVLTLSITDAVLRFGLDKNLNSTQVIKTSLSFLVSISILVIILTPLIGLYEPLKDYKWIFTSTLIVFMFRSTLSFYLKTINKNILFAVDTIIYTVLLALFNIFFLVVLNMDIDGYMYSLILASGISILFSIISSKLIFNIFKVKFSFNLLKRMLKYSTPLIVNALSWWITHSSDKFMLEFYNGTGDVGVYSAAAKIPALLTAVYSLFSQAWTLSSVKEFDESTDKSFYNNVFKMYCCVMFGATSFILLIIKPFILVYVGSEFVDCWQYVPALLIAALFGSLSSFFGAIYVAARKNIRCTISTLICAIINIILNFILIPPYGIMGASIATAVSYMVVGIYRLVDCKRMINLRFSYIKNIIAVVLVLAQAVLVVVSEYRYVISAFVIIVLIILYFSEIKLVFSFVFNRKKKKQEGEA